MVASRILLRYMSQFWQPPEMVTRKRWTRDELLVALNLYHKLTFGQLHARNPAIIALAEKLGRGANSVAMKRCNVASLAPALALRKWLRMEPSIRFASCRFFSRTEATRWCPPPPY